VADVAVAGGKIARIATNIPPESARQTIDANGLYVTPGLIDIHSHVESTGIGRTRRRDTGRGFYDVFEDWLAGFIF
jgi:dihydroorotase-like cyclic amidohydrolase